MNIRNYIAQGARRRHLDPAALLAVFQWEGLSGRIGDGGHAFGPGQMNDAGGVLTGRFPGWSPKQKQAWAMSPAGLNDLLNRIGQVARGKHGEAAINDIVRRFERPKHPDLEVRRAIQSYGRVGKVGGGEAGPLGPSAPAAAQAAAPDRHELAQQLVAMLGERHPDVGALIPLVAAARAKPKFEMPARPQMPGRPQPQQAVRGGAKAGSASADDARVVQLAKKWLGTPYVWGGTSRKGVDCSALLQKVWGEAGVKIPRVTYDQWKTGTPVGRKQVRAGDAVFFRMGPRGPEHVGMYLGNGKFIEAAHTGTNVRISSLAGRTDFVGARRYG